MGAHTHAAYEQYAHQRLSGFPQAVLDDIESGKCPETLDEEGKVVFEMATKLFEAGPLPASLWGKAVATLGVQGSTAVVHYVGYYKYIATILNGFDAQIPEVTAQE